MESCSDNCSFCEGVKVNKLHLVVWCDKCHARSATYEVGCIKKLLKNNCACSGKYFLVPFEYLKIYDKIYNKLYL